jgi:uncharacterized membrane protein YphA (DoxX/SURF4 family)
MLTRGFSVFLAFLRIAAGLGLLLAGTHKLGWFSDPALLSTQLGNWTAHPANQLVAKYLGWVSQHAAIFARLVVIGELTVGGLLVVGFLTPLMALLGFLMVLNFAFASGQMFGLGWYTGSSGCAYLFAFLVIFAGRGGTALGVDGLLAGRKQKAQ